MKNKAKYVYKYNTAINEELENATNELYQNNEDETVDEVPIISEPYDRVIVEYEVFNDRLDEADIATDLGHKTSNTKASSVFCKVPNLINDDEYYYEMERLNEKQRKYVLHILHCVKNDKQLPIYDIILGSAGVGKSCLIKALYQTLLRYYFKQPDCNPEQLHFILCAPTGKASHNIGGTTMHTAFILPVNQYYGALLPLTSSNKNTLYSKLRDLKFILIDEISMVGAKMLQYTDLRLKQIFDNN